METSDISVYRARLLGSHRDITAEHLPIAKNGDCNGFNLHYPIESKASSLLYIPSMMSRQMRPKRTLASTYQTIRASLMRYVAHKPSAWNEHFETYARIRYAWTLSADWPRPARVQALIDNVIYLDLVVYDWGHIQATTTVYGRAEDMLSGSPAAFREGMKRSEARKAPPPVG